MKTNLTARNLELTDRLRSQIERKLQRLDRIAHPTSEASVELIDNASHASESSHVVEVTLVTNGHVLRSSAAGATTMAAVDVVLDKIERQLVRSKQRRRSIRERATDEVVEVLARAGAGVTDGVPEPRQATVVKLKRFDMVPMFEEDAIARMEELGHEFFVFLNAETDAIGVVYRRRDGAYGLIEPMIDRRGHGS